MSRRESWEADLRALRQSAKEHLRHACHEATARLLSRLPLPRALELTQVQVSRRLPSFEHLEPAMAWPRQLLEAMAKSAPVEGWEWPEEQACHGASAADRFIRALRSLWKSSTLLASKHEKIAAMADAIEDCVIFDMMEDANAARRIGLEAWQDVARCCEEALERCETQTAEDEGQDADILALREAIERRDWNSCRFMAGRLLSRMPLSQALSVTREQVALRLPAFERHQPGVTWPRLLIDSIPSMSAGDEWQWPEEDSEFSGPGANNFIASVEQLWRASLVLTDSDQRIEAMVDAIAAAILSGMTEGWASSYPETWERARYLRLYGSSQEEESESISIQFESTRTPEYTEIERQSWLAFAARCAQVLGLDWKP